LSNWPQKQEQPRRTSLHIVWKVFYEKAKSLGDKSSFLLTWSIKLETAILYICIKQVDINSFVRTYWLPSPGDW
jgi:hypothetical protein